MLFYYINKNVGSVTCHHTPTFIVEPELLVEQGYQQRRKYADIEKVVHEAKLLREKINAARK